MFFYLRIVCDLIGGNDMRKILWLVVTLFVMVGLVGCGNSTVEKAIEKGKLALADNDIEKAESSFNLALTEDPKNKEAGEWLKLIETYNQFKSQVENKEIDNANKTLQELKDNEKYSIIKVITKSQEEVLKTTIDKIKALDNQIAELVQLYNPEDENSMPDENYLAKSDELLANPDLTEEQKKKVEAFKKDATERANILLAKMAEEQRKAEEQQAAAEKSKEKIDRKRAEEILAESRDVDRSIAGIRSEPEMDEVINGVTYYFFDIYALTEGFAADAWYVSSADGTVVHSSEILN